MEKEYSKDELEEKDLVECCKHCLSLYITEEDHLDGSKYCNTCCVVDYTVVIPFSEWEKKHNVLC